MMPAAGAGAPLAVAAAQDLADALDDLADDVALVAAAYRGSGSEADRAEFVAWLEALRQRAEARLREVFTAASVSATYGWRSR